MVYIDGIASESITVIELQTSISEGTRILLIGKGLALSVGFPSIAGVCMGIWFSLLNEIPVGEGKTRRE